MCAPCVWRTGPIGRLVGRRSVGRSPYLNLFLYAFFFSFLGRCHFLFVNHPPIGGAVSHALSTIPIINLMQFTETNRDYLRRNPPSTWAPIKTDEFRKSFKKCVYLCLIIIIIMLLISSLRTSDRLHHQLFYRYYKV